MTAWNHFLEMGGYAVYVWSAYASVMGFLMLQWFFPWRRWKNYVNQQKRSIEK